MDVSKINLEKIMAMLAQTKVELPPLTDIAKSKITVNYIKNDGVADSRQIWLYTPKNAEKPMPLVYVGHYEMPIDSLEIRDYLTAGFAVASCADFKGEYNAALTGDDLVFNNAALYTLRNMAEIDVNRIAVVGGSAGGYMSLMLNAMQLGICCSVANGPICNVYFNLYCYFNSVKKYNEEAIKAAFASGAKDYVALLSVLPIPFLGLIVNTNGFEPKNEVNFDNYDIKALEEISPTAFAECFCNPLYINHATSDILVPIDQLTRKFTYEKNGETLPEDFSCRMPYDIEGKLGFPLCERLDQSQLNLFSIAPLTDGADKPFEFDKSKRFNVCICDEGAPESYASHNLGISTGRLLDIEYIKYMFDLTAAKSNVLTEQKLLLFAERYAGKARQLIAHEGVDDNLYGSLSVYRKEILDELKKWSADNGSDALKAVSLKAIELDSTYRETINEIAKKVINE